MIRETTSVCPVCFHRIAASVIERQGAVFLCKECPEHGKFELLLSRHPDYYKDLDSFYFSVMDRALPQRDYMINLTNRCNLQCPICLADANTRGLSDLPLEVLRDFLRGKKRVKIDLMGAEPTLREDLPDMIRMIRCSGNIPALHTNGLRLEDADYLKRLCAAGMSEVHLQFDGFDDEAYLTLRGKPLLQSKQRILDNLRLFKVPTDLVATIARGVNEGQVLPILDFGVREMFVKEAFFLGCRYLGNAKNLPIDICMMPDEIIDLLEQQTHGGISRDNIKDFQKLYFSLLAALGIRKCFYIQHYILFRNGAGGYQTFEKLFDLRALQKNISAFKGMKAQKHPLAAAYLVLSLMVQMARFRNWPAMTRLLSYGKPFLKGFDLSRLSNACLLLGFISACDGYSYDEDIARHCGKGFISATHGVQDSGAYYNILNEKKT